MRKTYLFILLLILFATIIAEARPIVVLTTDFGLNGDAVGLCHGNILTINSEIEIVDLCHNIKPFDIKQASFCLKRTGLFPKDTVFVTVVDPGVGTTRNSIAIKTKKNLFYIAPNNGILTHVIHMQGIKEVYELDNKKINPQWVRGTFDGRDLYSPAGAILATTKDLKSIGHKINEKDVILLDFKSAKIYEKEGIIEGIYIETDQPYGNVWTNITQKDFQKLGIKLGDQLEIIIGKHKIHMPFVTSFGEVPEGSPLAYINSDSGVAFALNMDNFKAMYGLDEGDTVIVKKIVNK